MADFLLDLNILRYWENTGCIEHPKVLDRVNAYRLPHPTSGYVSKFFASLVTLGEIEYGHRVSRMRDPTKQAQYELKEAEFLKFVREQCPEPLEFSRHVSEQYGELKAWLFNNCGPTAKRSNIKRAEELVYPVTGKELGIDENDIWVAAHAHAYNLVLVTHDSCGNFGKVLNQFAATLKLEDWAA